RRAILRGGVGWIARADSKAATSFRSIRYLGRPPSRVAAFIANNSPDAIHATTLRGLTPHILANTGGDNLVRRRCWLCFFVWRMLRRLVDTGASSFFPRSVGQAFADRNCLK